jgi:hypothetical protein
MFIFSSLIFAAARQSAWIGSSGPARKSRISTPWADIAFLIAGFVLEGEYLVLPDKETGGKKPLVHRTEISAPARRAQNPSLA